MTGINSPEFARIFRTIEKIQKDESSFFYRVWKFLLERYNVYSKFIFWLDEHILVTSFNVICLKASFQMEDTKENLLFY